MIPTNKAINRCRTLRGCVMLLLGSFFRSNGENFDETKLDDLLSPLPEADKKKVRDHFLGVVRVWHNYKIYGKKLSNTSMNRRIARLDVICYQAEFDFADIWNRNHPEATCTR